MSDSNIFLIVAAIVIAVGLLSWLAPAAYAVIELTFCIISVSIWAFYTIRNYRLSKLVQNV